MSAIAGIAILNGQRLAPGAVQEMAHQAFVPGEDDRGVYTGPSVGLACRQVHTTAEGPFEQQPVVSADGKRVLVFDGRLDNRRELCSTLGISSSEARQLGDAGLVLRAYEAWGESSPKHLYGDYSFAVWDEVAHRLFCARDLIGVRSFYYHFDGSRFLFATQLRQLFVDSRLAASREWDLEFFADFMVHGSSDNVRTPFRAVRKLPPAHIAVVTPQGLRTETYWEPPDQKLLYRTDDEYAEHFLHLFREGVSRQLRCRGPIFSDLSGGLDSPSIVSMAQEIIRESGSPRSFHTITHVFDKAPRSDERTWAAMVAEKYGFSSHRLRVDDYPPLGKLVENASFWDEPLAQIGASCIHRGYLDILQPHGAKVLLNGMGAEEVLTPESPEPLHLADLVQERRWGDLAHELGVWQEVLDVPLHRLVVHSCIKPLLMPQRNYYLNRTRRSVPNFVNQEFARKWDLRGRFQAPWMPRCLRRSADQWQFERLFRATPQLQMGLLGKFVEMRYPFFYRPLIEFGLAVPWERKIDPESRKPILRRAMKGILPEPLRTRVRKVGGNHGFFLAVADQWDHLEHLAREPVLSELGVVDQEKFYRALTRARHGVGEQPAVLGWTLGLEAWVRSFSP